MNRSRQSISAFVVAGTQSGVGKTTISLGIMAALRQRGLKVQPFKIGPDFIDPGLHAKVCRVPSYNLDGWMLPGDYNRRTFRQNAQDKEVAVVEGVMGLYDGRSGATEEGSTAQMAKQLGLPVVLVIDAAAMARSAAAMILGYRLFDRRTQIIGVIFNQVGGKGHLRYLNEALTASGKFECFGGMPFTEQVKMPERHLGLAVAEEKLLDGGLIHRLGRWAENHLELDRLLKKTRVTIPTPSLQVQNQRVLGRAVPLAVARDKAFCFYYPDNLRLLEEAGAKLNFFSPMTNRTIPAGTQGIYLGGGYPELYAEELSRNRPMRAAIRSFIEAGGPVYAECGGFMYLAEALVDGKKREYPMVGIYPFKSSLSPRLQALGYRQIVFRKKSFLPAGESARGHEFHYSELKRTSTKRRVQEVYIEQRGSTESCAGYLYKKCLASYAHLHFGSNPGVARRFVEACGRSQTPDGGSRTNAP